MAASIFATAYVTSQYFQISRGDSPLGTGLRFLPRTMTPLLIAPVAGKLVDRLGARVIAAPGLVLQAVGFVWLLHQAHTHASYGAFVAPFVVAGVGISMALPAPSAAGLNAAPPELLGRAAGVLNTVQQIGQATGVAAVTVVFDAHGSLKSPSDTCPATSRPGDRRDHLGARRADGPRDQPPSNSSRTRSGPTCSYTSTWGGRPLPQGRRVR